MFYIECNYPLSTQAGLFVVIDDAEDALGGENVEHDSCEHENAPGVNFSLSVIRGLWVGVMIHVVVRDQILG